VTTSAISTKTQYTFATDPDTGASGKAVRPELSVIGIDSIGNIRGCESLYDDSFIEGNVRNEPLERIWFRENRIAYNRQFDRSLFQGNCSTCDMLERCRGGLQGLELFSTGSSFHNVYCSR